MTDEIDRDYAETRTGIPNGPHGVAGGASRTNVTSLRMPGAVPPEAQALALERLVSAMTMVATINRTAIGAYRVAFQTAMAAAHYGDQGMLVEKVLANLLKQLDASIAGLPNQPPPAA